MTALPSFVELMSTLGLDKQAPSDVSSSPRSTPPLSPAFQTTPSRHVRARSAPSTTEQHCSFRLRGARFSPYHSPTSYSRQSSSSGSSPTESDFEQPQRAFSSSPRLPSPASRRQGMDTSVCIHIYDSSTDLSANTPISSYVRRKTPPESPSPVSYTNEVSPSAYPMPFTLPTLPPLFSLSTASLPLTSSDNESTRSTKHRSESLGGSPTRRSYRYGLRISAPPHSTDLALRYARRHVAPVA